MTRPDEAAAPIPALVNRDYSTGPVDQRWCGDLAEIPTGQGKLYLAIVLDLGSRRLPGFAMSEHHDSAVAKAALCMAAAVRGGDVDGVIFHSDKGGEYVGDLFTTACNNLGVWAARRRDRRDSGRPRAHRRARAHRAAALYEEAVPRNRIRRTPGTAWSITDLVVTDHATSFANTFLASLRTQGFGWSRNCSIADRASRAPT
ncbi:MAG: DDE-type integrase/transposase/recombinase [Planctomycetaceae bacterium]|nr:DDE-type integrase/transposase/recombinase [Planctomycetaceae bacterium]